jgi:hypothetical protein
MLAPSRFTLSLLVINIVFIKEMQPRLIRTASSAHRLSNLPNEIILNIIGFLDLATIFLLTCVSKQFEILIQRGALYSAWNKIRLWKKLEDGIEFPELEVLPRSLLFAVCFRKFRSDNYRTQLLLKSNLKLRTAPRVFGELLEDTFCESGDSRETQLLLGKGVDLTQVPCGLPKLLENTFRKCGDSPPTQLLLKNGADFTQVPCGLPKLLEDTFRKWGDSCHTQLLCQTSEGTIPQ